MRKLKIGMISFAHGHANSYLRELLRIPDVEIVGIADENRARVEKQCQTHNLRYFESHHELLQTDADAVVICSETVHHGAHCVDAAFAGKHVLCEKPLGLSVEAMQQMIEVCKQQNVQLMTAFPCRYLPAVMEAKKMVAHGHIGNIMAIKGTNRGTMPGKWFIDPQLSGGGAIIDHTVHVMDLLNWMIGSEVTEVYAESGTLFHDIPVEDAGMVHVKFENGAVAVIDTSWSRAKSFPFGTDITMEIVGEEGVISVDAFNQKNEVYSDEKMKAQWSYWGDGMDRYMMEAFIDSIRGGLPVPINGLDGLKSTAVALASYESIKQGRPVSMKSFIS